MAQWTLETAAIRSRVQADSFVVENASLAMTLKMCYVYVRVRQ